MLTLEWQHREDNDYSFELSVGGKHMTVWRWHDGTMWVDYYYYSDAGKIMRPASPIHLRLDYHLDDVEVMLMIYNYLGGNDASPSE